MTLYDTTHRADTCAERTQVSANIRTYETVRNRTDHCGHLRQKYATVHTNRDMLDFCGLQLVESHAYEQQQRINH